MVHFSEEMPQRVDSGGNVAGRRFVALDGAGARGQAVQHPLDPEIVDRKSVRVSAALHDTRNSTIGRVDDEGRSSGAHDTGAVVKPPRGVFMK